MDPGFLKRGFICIKVWGVRFADFIYYFFFKYPMYMGESIQFSQIQHFEADFNPEFRDTIEILFNFPGIYEKNGDGEGG